MCGIAGEIRPGYASQLAGKLQCSEEHVNRTCRYTVSVGSSVDGIHAVHAIHRSLPRSVSVGLLVGLVKDGCLPGRESA